MENKWTVYEHVSPSGRKYVGISSNLSDRWKSKGRNYCTYNSIFKKAIEKYGWDNIQHNVVVSNVGFKTACNMEKDFIAFNKAKGISYNITDGGEGTLGRVPSEETRSKISKANKGVPPSQLAIMNSINSPKRKESNLKNIEIAHAAWKGCHHSEETKKRMSEKAKGRDMRKAIEAARKVPHGLSCRKAVVQYSLSGEYIQEFISLAEASKKTGVGRTSISNCLSKRACSAGNFKWQYKGKEDKV